ncbi:hypothetical protein BKI52_42530 [marine bacterium AO1-C]|nr:hypothetical protein BKI52_42530 [marine bacterium AO1-C]
MKAHLIVCLLLCLALGACQNDSKKEGQQEKPKKDSVSVLNNKYSKDSSAIEYEGDSVIIFKKQKGLPKGRDSEGFVIFDPVKGKALFDDKKMALKISVPEQCIYQFDLNIYPWDALKQAFSSAKNLTVTISATFKDGDHVYDRQFQFLPVNPKAMHYNIKIDMCKFGYITRVSKAAFKIQGHLQSGKEVFQTLIYTSIETGI